MRSHTKPKTPSNKHTSQKDGVTLRPSGVNGPAQDAELTGLLVSIQKARRILGPLVATLDDTQVKDIIISLHLLAREQM